MPCLQSLDQTFGVSTFVTVKSSKYFQNEWFKNQIDHTGVTGSSELIKLYAPQLTSVLMPVF
jgi:hypothetical protein